MLKGNSLGMEYTFTIRAVPSPMAYRARAILPTRARISGFGNTREAATRDMMNKVRNYVECYYPPCRS